MTVLAPAAAQTGARLAHAAAALFTCASAGTNVLYGWSKGTDVPTSFVWSVVSLGASLVFALSWPALVRCLDAHQWSRAVLVVLALVLTGGYSVSAALGSAMSGRVNAAADERNFLDVRTKAQAAYDAADGELKVFAQTRPNSELQALVAAAEADLVGLPPSRSTAQIQALIDGVRLNPQSADCAAINGSLRMHCPRLPEWKAELVRAQERQKKTDRLTELRAELGRSERYAALKAERDAASRKLDQLGPARIANGDAQALAVYLTAIGIHVTADRLNDLLALLAVLVIECGGGLALTVGMSLSTPIGNPEGRKVPVTKHARLRKAAPDRSASAAPIATSQQLVPSAAGAAATSQQRFLDLLAARGGQIVAGQRALAEALGVSKTQINRLLTNLSAAGTISLATNSKGTEVKVL